MVRLINLTPHEITLVGGEGKVLARIPPSGRVVRLAEEYRREAVLEGGPYAGVSIGVKVVGAAEDLPPRVAGTLYIVSLPVALLYPERDDFVVPHDYVRDENGRVLGCRALARVVGVRQ